MSDKNTHQSSASLREAAQNALTTLDGIANANPRDTADFETPAEWIVWAKSRASWAADALREPIAQEVYAERILKQMLHEDSKATQADHFPEAGKMIEPAQAGELPDEREAQKVSLMVLCAIRDVHAWHPNMLKDIDFAIQANRAALSARKPSAPADHFPDAKEMVPTSVSDGLTK